MRCLADLALLLGQYSFAVQMYRLAAQDYQAASNSRWYAGAEVSLGRGQAARPGLHAAAEAACICAAQWACVFFCCTRLLLQQEMIGLCSILTADPSADPVKYLTRAFEHYSRARGRLGRMLATRAMADAAAYLAASGRCAAPLGLHAQKRAAAAIHPSNAAVLLPPRPPPFAQPRGRQWLPHARPL